MFKTRMTELFGIQHPIMLAGMNWITEPGLVAAVCNAGGLGMLATARFSPDETRQNIREVRWLTDKPFGVNQALVLPGARENVEVAIEEKVPVFNYALGKRGLSTAYMPTAARSWAPPPLSGMPSGPSNSAAMPSSSLETRLRGMAPPPPLSSSSPW